MFSKKVDEQEAYSMINAITNKEIKEAMFDIDDNKALGPDGFTAKFFKKHGMLLEMMSVKQGLRQEDPLSPYLFTIVMEVFNLILQQEILRNGRFKYHYVCKELEITHLCFADDLLVLCHGDVNSVIVFKKALEKFSTVSILGVPLVSKKIGVKDSKGLIDKVKARIQYWKNKSLSYAGRTQLIASVLSSIQAGVFGRWKNSWIWRSLFDLRIRARENIVYKIGNGKNASVWHDRWSEKPFLDSIVSRREIYSAGFSNNADVEDKPVWKTKKWNFKACSCNQAWKDIRILSDQVHWWKVIWFSQNIPRQAFVFWMAMKKKKLVTQDKLALCMLTEDSHNHFFLNVSIQRKLTIASTVYHIWQERNFRVFQKKERSPSILCQVIRDNVKCRLLSLKVKNSKAVKDVEEVWKITMNIKPGGVLLGVTVLMNASFLVQFGLGRKLASYVWYYERSNSGERTIR
nr:hypothetical protein [Tanacetum cinerariifolium]